MIKKISIGFVIMALLFAFSVTAVRAQEASIDVKAELGIENVGRLPGSPWYFLKELRRGISKLFAFGSVRKAEVELEIANEKAAEVVVLEEKEPLNTAAIKQAMANYGESKERLAERVKRLEAESDNPNVEKLLIKIEEQSAKHAEVFSKLEARFKVEPVELESGLDMDFEVETKVEVEGAAKATMPSTSISEEVEPVASPATSPTTSLETSIEQDLEAIQLPELEYLNLGDFNY